MFQLIRPIASGLIVALIAGGFLFIWMHAPIWFAVANAAVIGVVVLAISGSAPTARDEAADQAWADAAPDLPPHSERREMERDQAALPAPVAVRSARRTTVAHDDALDASDELPASDGRGGEA